METYKPFSIIVVPFPFTDSEQAKKRPALVLSTEEHQKQTSHITLLMITTGKNSYWLSDYSITHLENTGVSFPSIIRQKLFTIDSRLVVKSIGKLHEADKHAVINGLKRHLAY